jgi:hypothetical protein
MAPIFTNIQGTGISFTYDTETNSLSATVSGSGGSVSDFGDGFSLDNANKIVTRKLYSTNPNDSNIHYRLELTTGGTIKLPDSSEIIGSTLKGIYGTGDLNYTGITIGPNSGNSENTWMYVDAYNAYIATDYGDTQKTWKFDDSGNLTLPFGGVIKNNNGTNILDGLGAGTSGTNIGNFSFASDIITFPNNNGQIGQLALPYTGLEFRTGSGADWIGISYGEINDNNTSYFYFDKDGSDYTTANHRAHLQIKNPAHDGHVEWLFDSDGVLTFPSGNMTMGDLNGSEGIQGSANTPIGVLSHGPSGAASLQWVDNLQTPTAVSGVVVNSPFANTGSVQIVTGTFDPMNPTAEHSWTFGNDGKLSLPSDIKFSDDTVQTTAWTGSNPINYANIINVPIAPEVDIDGGHALAYFTIPASADGGGSSQRFGPNSPTINGGVAIETHTNTLDGGGA